MRNMFLATSNGVILLALVGFTGCNRSTAPPPETTASDEHGHDHADGHDHGHGSAGPHGGQIIELGEEEFHAEFLHDDSRQKVGVHMLDSSAAKPAPIDATSIVINCMVGGKPAQFTLNSVAQEGETAGTASYFELVSKELSDALDAEGANPRLNVTISGKPYVGEVGAHAH
jgi:hypothetical protein